MYIEHSFIINFIFFQTKKKHYRSLVPATKSEMSGQYGDGKGQLISKGLFAILEFFQKTTETIQSIVLLGKKPNSFVRFLEESSGWKKTLRLWLTFSGSTTRYQLKSTEFKYILERIQWIQWRSYLLQRVKTLAKMLRGGPFLLVVKKSVNSIWFVW